MFSLYFSLFPLNWTVFCFYRGTREVCVKIHFCSKLVWKPQRSESRAPFIYAKQPQTLQGIFWSDQTADKSSPSPNVNTILLFFIVIFKGHMKLLTQLIIPTINIFIKNNSILLIKNITAIALQNIKHFEIDLISMITSSIY